MTELTYRLCKEHFGLYTENHGSTAVNSYYIEHAKKDEIILEGDTFVLYSKLTSYNSR